MLTYNKYTELNGTLSEAEFASLFPKVQDLLQSFVEEFVASWKIKDTLEEYGDFDRAIVYQIDFISNIGGESVFNGVSDLDVKEVSTGNFKYSVNSNIKKVNGVPIAPIAITLVMKELSRGGFLSRSIND